MFKRFAWCMVAAISSLAIYSFVIADDPIAKIRQQLDKWTDKHPIEKAYVHFDKPYYAAGDDIWLKVYVTSGSYNQATTISGIVNVDLIDARDSIKRSLKLQLKNGVAWGDIALPDTLSAGNYRLRAYTNYMRNAGGEYFFEKAILIINAVGKIYAKQPVAGAVGTQVATAANKIDIQFFPEGGSLVAGVPTKVAFKAVSSSGLGADVSGTIISSQGRQVATFSSTHLGMGYFTITPQASVTYTANVSTADDMQTTAALPKVASSGYVLNIMDQGNAIQVKVSGSNNLLNQNASLTLVAQTAGKIYYAGVIKPGTVTIEKNKFPTGIAQFTLFSATGEPLNERLVFIKNADRLNLALSTDKPTYSPRERVRLNLSAFRTGQKPAAGSFSVSVINETKVPVDESNENSIFASLLLTSDIKGYVEQPAYYFNNPNEKTAADLDLLMITQGYRRFDWKQVLNSSAATDTFTPEQSLKVSGTITTDSGKPVPNGKVQLIDFDDAANVLDTVTDAQGRFNFDNLEFADSVRFIVQARNAKNKRDVVIHLDSIAPAPTNSSHVKPDFEITSSDKLSVYAESSKALYSAQLKYGLGNHVISLREVVIREKKQALKHSANLNGPGNADQVIYGKDLRLMGCIRIGDCLQGRILGVVFRNGIPFSTRGGGPMQVIIDGVYVDASFINSINNNDVQSIEVLRNVGTIGVYGGRAGSGVLLITTKRGDEPEEYTGPVKGRGIKPYYPKGLYKARTFYSPAYNKSGVNKEIADLRTTIYWNPDVQPGTNGKAILEYFNAGSKGTYRVIAEGIDSDGNIARKVYRYRVE
ncbi:TonB-dependent receptor [Mucilaginibacter pallidiroseus]|uniref:TonB-dependent receptor n=1 Tax=Mucilaginibacter pallidiroseus TaxID=2599295 RepID=A0A563UGQ0_9SPHI|nr:TonB-dependent receptor plug domain-containing protein [Mucilaginibacter pallidiroseus]TWR30458.1 TonB-dependent receptor [Mucilaginibacter pallidiroseus]